MSALAERPTMAPAEVLRSFLHALYDSAERGEVMFNYQRGAAFMTAWHDLVDIDAMAGAASATPGNVWVPIGTRTERLPNGRRGSKEDVLDVFALAVDVDVLCDHHTRPDLPPTLDDARLLLGDYPHAPSIVVDTGGGLQAWFLLAEPASAADAAPVLGRWGASWKELGRRRGWHVDSTSSVEHVFRAPGTYNATAGAPVTVERATAHRYDLAQLDEATVAPDLPPRVARPARTADVGLLADLIGDLPGDTYNRRTTCDALLDGAGFEFSHQSNEGDRHYFAPHRIARKERTGATVYRSDGHVTIWSQTWADAHGLDVERPYDAFGLFTHLEHGGDFAAAARAVSGASNGNGHHPAGAQARSALDELFDSRPTFAQIRDAARARRVSPTAVFGAVLARLAAFTPPTTHVPPFIGGTVPLTVYVALMGATGRGKSSPARTARDLLPDTPPGVVGPVPLGSGEGFAEAYLERVTGDKGTTVRQTRYGALFDLDEGRALAEIGNRRGSTILPTLCSAWSGGDLGQANAGATTYRHVPAGGYSAGLLAAFQPARAAGLLDDVDGGAPGRFLWLPTGDDNAPDTPPDWPGSLDWKPPSQAATPLTYDPAIAAEIDAQRLAELRGDATPDALDAHRGLLKLKVAGLLAVLDNRRDVTPDDWHAAELVLRLSDLTRALAVEHARSEERRREESATARAVRREVAIADTAEHRALTGGARAMARRAHRGTDTVSRGDLSRAASSRTKALASVDDMLEHAVSEGWLERTEDGYRPGRSQPS